jgi:hypothetical protein
MKASMKLLGYLGDKRPLNYNTAFFVENPGGVAFRPRQRSELYARNLLLFKGDGDQLAELWQRQRRLMGTR